MRLIINCRKLNFTKNYSHITFALCLNLNALYAKIDFGFKVYFVMKFNLDFSRSLITEAGTLRWQNLTHSHHIN